MKQQLVPIVIAAAVALLVAGFLARPAQQAIDQTIGAVSVLSSPLEVNGAQVFLEGKRLATGTTTVCAIKSPAATSTLVFADVDFSVSSTTASIIHLAKATTAFATTTSLGSVALAANAQGTVVASTSPAAGAATVFAPNTYFVVGMAGGVGTFSPVGNCTAQFVR